VEATRRDAINGDRYEERNGEAVVRGMDSRGSIIGNVNTCKFSISYAPVMIFRVCRNSASNASIKRHSYAPKRQPHSGIYIQVFQRYIHSSSRLGMRISQLRSPGCMPSHQLYKRPISRMKIRVLQSIRPSSYKTP
jgi:hypothetical protein